MNCLEQRVGAPLQAEFNQNGLFLLRLPLGMLRIGILSGSLNKNRVVGQTCADSGAAWHSVLFP